MGCGGSKGPYPAGLPAGVALPEGVEVLSSNSATDVQETVDMAARSYAGTEQAPAPAEFAWQFGPDLADPADPAQQKGRAHCLTATMAYCIHYAFLLGDRGLVLIAREPTKIVGHCVLHFYSEGWKPAGGFAQMKAGGNAGYSKWSKAQQDFTSSKKDVALQKVLANLHKAHASGPHIYVEVLAVDPDSQGKGVGGKLMRLVSAIADAAKLSLYLECDCGKNEAVYQKFGYAKVGTETLAVGTEKTSVQMCAMRRECK